MLDKTVEFNDENSWEDFGIVFESMTIGKAEPQLVLIDVPFRNGSLDETDYFGDVRYKNRTITMGFLIPWWSDDQYEIFGEVQNNLNGKRKRITFSADEDWYYEGRLTVGDFKIDNGFFKFDITATCDPYKYSDSSKSVYFENDDPISVILENDYMKTIPSFTCNVPIIVSFEENLYNFSEGTHSNPSIVFKKGKNYITVSIDGETEETEPYVTISYRQGRL